jgi:hypothetical protein
MDDAVESYLTELARTEHEEPVLLEMEARAAEHRFPIVGRATGRFLELAARAVGAHRVMELGSGYGYSAYWFARAVGLTARSSAPTAIRRTPAWQRNISAPLACGTGWRYRVGDALQGSRRRRATWTSCTATATSSPHYGDRQGLDRAGIRITADDMDELVERWPSSGTRCSELCLCRLLFATARSA